VNPLFLPRYPEFFPGPQSVKKQVSPPRSIPKLDHQSWCDWMRHKFVHDGPDIFDPFRNFNLKSIFNQQANCMVVDVMLKDNPSGRSGE
jgi:hypothetical protein